MKRNTQKIRRLDLANMLHENKGATFVSFTIESDGDEKMNKGGRAGVPANPWLGKLIKRTTVFGIIGSSYTNAVNNQREREDSDADFAASAHAWATRIGNTCLMTHNKTGKIYVAIQQRPAEHINDSCFVEKSTGRILADSEVATWKKKSSPNKSQDLADPVVWLTLCLDNVRYANIKGVKYEVIASSKRVRLA